MIVDWYFDFISPFAYLQWSRLGALPSGVELRPKPVLLAAILKHWGQLGPAEIAPKRRFTYQQVTWLAARAGLPFTMPAGHPFNPLPLLRLAWLLGPTPPLVDRLFRYVWQDGHVPQQPDHWTALLAEVGGSGGVDDAGAKTLLRHATDEAIGRGAFGVPTAVVGAQLFWGYDATDMLLDYCRNPRLLDSEAMRRAAATPVAASRATRPA